MRKPANFSLSLDNPCDEKWEGMTPNEEGRYCGSCEKTVVDFSTMTDSELIHFFANYKKGSKICGRISKSQLERSFPKARAITAVGLAWRRAAAAVLLLGSLAQPLAANSAWMPAGTELRQDVLNPKNEKENSDEKGNGQRMFNGYVRSESNTTNITGATVQIMQGKKIVQTATTDSTGFFSIEISQKQWRRGFKVLFSATDHSTLHYRMKAKKNGISMNKSTQLDFLFRLQEQVEIMYLGGLGFND